MPELPELEIIKENLVSQIKGKKIQMLKILKPYILKNYFIPLENRHQFMEKKKNESALAKPIRKIHSNGSRARSKALSYLLTGFTEGLKGETVEGIDRRGKFLIIKLNRYKLIIHLMLRGSIKYALPTQKMKKTSAALLKFEDGTILEFNETGHKKRMAFYVLAKDELLNQIAKLGMEPLQRGFTVRRLKELLHSESKQVKSFLRDQQKIAGIGNAYADEILWKAGISPFKMTTKLNDDEIKNLHHGIVEILKWAITTLRQRGVSEKRDFLHIHQNKGRPCPRCNETIQVVSFAHAETFYCPLCQTGGKKLKDRRISKLYR